MLRDGRPKGRPFLSAQTRLRYFGASGGFSPGFGGGFFGGGPGGGGPGLGGGGAGARAAGGGGGGGGAAGGGGGGGARRRCRGGGGGGGGGGGAPPAVAAWGGRGRGRGRPRRWWRRRRRTARTTTRQGRSRGRSGRARRRPRLRRWWRRRRRRIACRRLLLNGWRLALQSSWRRGRWRRLLLQRCDGWGALRRARRIGPQSSALVLVERLGCSDRSIWLDQRRRALHGNGISTRRRTASP